MSDIADDETRYLLQQAQPQPGSKPENGRARAFDGAHDVDQDTSDADHDIDPARVEARVKGLYKEMLDAPIPDQMLELVRKMKNKESK